MSRLERQNRLDMFAIDGDRLSAAPLFSNGTLGEPGNIRGRQAAGTVHVHPNGRFVYVANRASSTVGEGASASLPAAKTRSPSLRSILQPASPPRSSMSIPAASIVAPFTSIRAARLLVAAHIMGLPVKDGAQSAQCRPASRCSASAPTASSISCANTMSMSATGRCFGWGWFKSATKARLTAVQTGASGRCGRAGGSTRIGSPGRTSPSASTTRHDPGLAHQIARSSRSESRGHQPLLDLVELSAGIAQPSDLDDRPVAEVKPRAGREARADRCRVS